MLYSLILYGSAYLRPPHFNSTSVSLHQFTEICGSHRAVVVRYIWLRQSCRGCVLFRSDVELLRQMELTCLSSMLVINRLLPFSMLMPYHFHSALQSNKRHFTRISFLSVFCVPFMADIILLHFIKALKGLETLMYCSSLPFCVKIS